MNERKGFLIAFEGGEACGKGTQIAKFKEYLNEKKIDFLMSREPGGTPVGENIRNVLLHMKNEISPLSELLLFSAARAQLIRDIVKPALNEGKVVVLDRYYYSTYAYQGTAGHVDLQDIKDVTKLAIDGAKPDLCILLDITYDESVKRKNNDANLKNLDRIESKGREFHERVRDGYLSLAKTESEIVVIDASKTIEQVFNEIVSVFEKKYQEKCKND